MREREKHYIVPANKADWMSTVSKLVYTRSNLDHGTLVLEVSFRGWPQLQPRRGIQTL